MEELFALGAKIGDRLKDRGERIAVAESSAGGLISAALLSRPGASAYFLGGAVVYTTRSFRALTSIDRDELKAKGIRSASEPFAQILAENVRDNHRADWGLSETGAAGPTGNSYGDAAGHTCLAVAGPHLLSRTLETGNDNRAENMLAFALAALHLLDEALASAS